MINKKIFSFNKSHNLDFHNVRKKLNFFKQVKEKNGIIFPHIMSMNHLLMSILTRVLIKLAIIN